ncbi:MAG: glycosyltransferase family 2 protein [Oscillospiraceae bacterium]|nr:glycosyltransferase family 2 protein [Oscillospiraceae bacterium]
MKVSLIIPVYYNEDNLRPLYADLKEKFIEKIDYDYEIVMVNDGSKDKSYEVMQELAEQDKNIKIISLSRNFGSHAAILCGLSHCTGDCAVVKAADLQEPTELILDMVESWKKGNNVVLAVREGRDESKGQTFFANFYYWIVRKTALPEMPAQGFDVYLVDRKVITVLENLDEKNSALTGQILWSGFKTEKVYYKRLAREIGVSRWTLKKKIRLVMDTLFSFTSLPITVVLYIGVFSVIIAVIWALVVLVSKLNGQIEEAGWTTLFIFNLLSFGITMLTLGILGEYLWRTFDASRNRPVYIVEEKNDTDVNTDDKNLRQ